MNPDVSVVIGAYNAVPYITRTVESVMQQSLGRERIELIAVDDCSTDGTLAELQRLATEWPGMRVLRLPANSGGASAPRNRGIAEATGRWVFILDADDYLGTEALERMVAMGDENEADVVLGKMVGVGGRTPPRTMYTANQPRADLYESRVYWTLNPMKLYRRELLDRVNLRFPEGVSFHEDQPFVAEAYLNARGISVVADYDCVYWVHRDDGGNITFSTRLQSRLDSHGRMFTLLAKYLPPGAKRDRLLQRHFQIDMMDTLRRLSENRPVDLEAREHAIAEMRRWVLEYYCEGIGRRLRPVYRIAYELVAQDRLADLAEVFADERETAHREWQVHDNTIEEQWPNLPGTVDLPDYCFDVTESAGVSCYLAHASWQGDVFRVAGHAYLRRIENTGSRVQLLLRLRGTETCYEVPVEACAEYDSRPCPDDDPAIDGADHAGSGFEASLDLASLTSGDALAAGLWDLTVRVAIEDVSCEKRIGAARAEHIDTTPCLRLIAFGDTSIPVASYCTDPFGNLSIDIGPVKHRLSMNAESPAWDSSGKPAVLIQGRINVIGVPDGAVVTRLVGPQGQQHDLATRVEEEPCETRFASRVALGSAASGNALQDGTWTVSVLFSTGAASATAKFPGGEGLSTIRWWRGLRPMHAKSPPRPGKSLRLHIRPIDMAHALRRRLGLRSAQGDAS